ncbi:PAS domain-containing protein [Thiohalocapsa marina]|uniref:PAS domain-containing protein n=1 Tax=Thiohalocapsa marina TaxID=424902 RepID=A0A5M8FN75_9GAMM|nr:PAS domain-containing protein [Thiohalocapsa marina]
MHPDDCERVDGLIRQCLQTLEDCVVEYRSRRPDGEGRWIGALGRVYCGVAGVGHRAQVNVPTARRAVASRSSCPPVDHRMPRRTGSAAGPRYAVGGPRQVP